MTYSMLIVVFIAVFCLSGCDGGDNDGTEDPVIIISDPLPGDWAEDPFTVAEAVINDDTLHLTVSYGGGCEKHEFSLLAGDSFFESDPAMVEVMLSHNAHGDPCEAMITKELTFDLSPLKHLYQEMYPDSENLFLIRFRDLSKEEGYFILAYNFDGMNTALTDETEVLQSEKTRELSPEVTDSDLRELAAGNTGFAFDLYHALRRNQEGNLFYSPYSISLALAMTYAGARGETEQEMGTASHFTLSQERLHPAFNALDIELAERGENAEGQDEKGFRLNIANSIWGQKGYSFLPDFPDVLAGNYGAGMRLTDFLNAPEESRTVINDWVSAKTEGRIGDLIPENCISEMTRLVLVSAIYFNAAWSSPFQEEFTRDSDFHLSDGADVAVPMMRQTDWLRYGEGEDWQAAELMYEGREISMVILLPRPGRFEEFENSLDADRLNEILDGFEYRYAAVDIPEFRYESDSVSLKETLSRMGMPTAFTWPGADFSGIDGTYNLFIGDVLHKSFISVDEAGTEAAAATAVIADMGGIYTEEPTDFTVSRPFIFFIRDIETGTVLFAGRILNPGVSR